MTEGCVRTAPAFASLRPMTRGRRVLAGLVVLVLTGCITNPVTGRQEVGFVSQERQIRIGEEQYLPAQQMQGGQYSVDPALTEYVRSVGTRLAAVSGVDLPYEFVVLNDSVPNAWAMPGGKLAINRGLLTELGSEAELAAVLGHEIVHAAGRHGAKAMERGVLAQVAVLGTAIALGDSGYAQYAVGGAAMAAGLVQQRYGRDAEREADHYGTRFMAKAGYDPMAAVTLQETFVRLSEGRKTGWLDGLFASHPPSTERVANNRALVETLRSEGFQGGEIGAESYAAAIRQLTRDEPAYAAADAARKALKDDKLDEAARGASQAIALQDAEPRFHSLLGDVRRAQGQFDAAIQAYGAAIALDDAYYGDYVGRGSALVEKGQRDRARPDFERSLKLLPTAVAYDELGRLAEASGDLDRALGFYQSAAESPTPVGQAARLRAVRIDLPRNPDRYLDASLQRDDRGQWVATVVNRTPLAVRNIEVRIRLVDAAGEARFVQRTLARLDAGAATRTAVAGSGSGVSDGAARVTAAQLVDPPPPRDNR